MRQITVTGMSCNHCVQAVSGALETLGLKEVRVDLPSGVCTFAPTDLSADAVTDAVEDLGFEVADVR